MGFRMKHYHYDMFTVEGVPGQTLRASFRTDEDGSIGAVAIPVEPEVDDIVFARAPAEPG